MPDYQQGKIYTIRCRTDDTLIYVGSTTQDLAVRWGSHKRCSKVEGRKDLLLYKAIKSEWDNWYIELLSLYPCSCVNELRRKEGEIIREIATLNKNIAGRTKDEYLEDKKEHLEEKAKEWRENNKERREEVEKVYRENNKDKIKLRNQIYNVKNKEIIAQKDKERSKIKITCECGSTCAKKTLNRHIKTHKHINFLALKDGQ